FVLLCLKYTISRSTARFTTVSILPPRCTVSFLPSPPPAGRPVTHEIMPVLLPVLSFVLAAFLVAFLTILLRRPSLNTPNIAFASWLLLANLVHAVNALIWASDVQPRVPVWCDIVTNLLLGATAALPGACVSSARAHELLASSRKMHPNTYSKRLHVLGDVALCFVFPLLYMVIHFAVQEHRFDLMRGLGCSASVQRSTPAVLLMVLPPLLLCTVALVLCLSSLWHCSRLSADRFVTHLAARSSVSAPRFIRRLAQCTLLTATVLLFTLLPLLAPRATFRTPDFSVIFIVKQPSEIGAAERAWWTVPGVSLAYLLLALVLGDEAADALAWMKRRVSGTPPPRPARPELSRLTFAQSKASLVAPTPVQLRSGWDDMLDVKQTRRGVLPGRKSVVSSAGSQYSLSSSPSPSPSPTGSPTTPADDAFTASTLTYLASPVAQALGLPSPVAAYSPGEMPPSPVKPSSSPILRGRTDASPPAKGLKPLYLAPPRQPIPEDTASTISSIWDAPWPLPPVSPSSLRRAPSKRDDGRAAACPMYSPVEPLYAPVGPPASVQRVPPPRRTQSVPRKPALKTLRRTRSREYAAADVIYMTRAS
ncbi:pheromone A receptor-domain-containing protein, partial [Mycena latifolia]